jgi:uncharacterized small protein (DUF1192 family)
MTQTKEQKQSYIAGLVEERRGYVVRGLDDKVAAVDAELRRLGAKAETPAKRATKRKAVDS